jgi:hypothetical protein
MKPFAHRANGSVVPVALAATLVLLNAPAHADGKPNEFIIEVDHETQAYALKGSSAVAPGEQVTISIINTNRNCFTYNATQVPKGDQQVSTKGAGGARTPPVTIKTEHQRNISAYKIKISKLPDNPAACQSTYVELRELDLKVDVSTVGLDLQFSAGPVVDGLTDKKYFLQSGSGGQSVVTRDSNSRDRANARLAVFAHLVNTKAERDSQWTWVPISFGLGFDDKTRYMLGTSMKLGDQWFVTGGAVLGKTATLPVGVSEGMSTTNQNLLTTMGQKNSTSWFLSVTFNFLSGKAKTIFEGLGQPEPKPADQKPK